MFAVIEAPATEFTEEQHPGPRPAGHEPPQLRQRRRLARARHAELGDARVEQELC